MKRNIWKVKWIGLDWIGMGWDENDENDERTDVREGIWKSPLLNNYAELKRAQTTISHQLIKFFPPK